MINNRPYHSGLSRASIHSNQGIHLCGMFFCNKTLETCPAVQFSRLNEKSATNTSTLTKKPLPAHENSTRPVDTTFSILSRPPAGKQNVVRRSNNQGTFPSQALTVGSAGDGSSPPFREGVGTGALGVGRSWRGAVGLVCPAVDGRAVAAERDLYSPGVGSTVGVALDVSDCLLSVLRRLLASLFRCHWRSRNRPPFPFWIFDGKPTRQQAPHHQKILLLNL